MFIANVNDHKYEFKHERDLIAFVLGIPMQRWGSPLEALKRNYNEAVDVVTELLVMEKAGKVGKEKASFTRLISRLDKFKEILSKKKTVEDVFSSAFNQILSLEGTGLLNGFGMCTSHGDRVLGNPEVTSILPPEIKRRRIVKNESKSTGVIKDS